MKKYEEIRVFKVDHDIYGNPRYVVHFLSLDIDIDDYDNVNKLYGFKRYKARWFGGGIVFQSYNIEWDLKYMINEVKRVKRYKERKEQNRLKRQAI